MTNPQSLRTTVIAITSVTAGLAVTIAAGRLFANRRILKAADCTYEIAELQIPCWVTWPLTLGRRNVSSRHL